MAEDGYELLMLAEVNKLKFGNEAAVFPFHVRRHRLQVYFNPYARLPASQSSHMTFGATRD